MTNMIAGAIATKIAALAQTVIQDLTSNGSKISIKDLVLLAENDATAKSCIEIKALRASRILGDYQIDNKNVQDWMRTNFENMNGSLPRVVRRLSSSMPLGRASAEIVWHHHGFSKFGEWRLSEINILDPRRVTASGSLGNVTDIKYDNGIKEVTLPIKKCLHIVNGSLNFDEKEFHGSGEMIRAFPYIKLKQLIYAQMGNTARKLATGILLAGVDSNNTVQMMDSQGKPIIENGRPKSRSVAAMLEEQLKNLESNSYIITDKANTLTPIQIPNGEGFWNLAIELCDRAIMRSFLVPQLVFSEGSGTLGVNGLGNTHLSVMDATIEQVVADIRDEMIEKLCKPLIMSKFGKQKNYGDFVLSQKKDAQAESLLMNTLVSTMSMGLIDATDLDAKNKLREYVGIAPITKEENAFQQQVQEQLQQVQQAQAAQMQPTPEQITDQSSYV